MAQNTTKIKIEFDLPTNKEDELETTKWRIIYCSFFTESLFNLIRKSVIYTDHQPFVNEIEKDQHNHDLSHACELGSAISYTICQEVEKLEDLLKPVSG